MVTNVVCNFEYCPLCITYYNNQIFVYSLVVLCLLGLLRMIRFLLLFNSLFLRAKKCLVRFVYYVLTTLLFTAQVYRNCISVSVLNMDFLWHYFCILCICNIIHFFFND